MMLSGKTVVLGVSGGIAAYKAVEVVSRLKKLGANVRVVMTKNACEFVAPLTFETISGSPVYVDSFVRAWEIEHISLAKSADLMLIAPATANVIGKIANGIADDLLTTTVMAMLKPILIAPAMNAVMYRSDANQANLALLSERGMHFIGPDTGNLACGDDDIGRMSEPAEIVERAIELLMPNPDLAGKTVLVTAGPTRESLDPVRYITNHSSGKMGYAIAEAARDRGADVVLVSGPVNIDAPSGVEVIGIETTAELLTAMQKLAVDADIVIQAAAPADFTPEHEAKSKIKKTDGALTLTFTENPDVAKTIGETKKPHQRFVVFAAETDNVTDSARAKLLKKGADMVVANDVTKPGAGFNVDTNQVTLIGRDFSEELPMLTKRQTADAIIDRVLILK